MQLNPCFGRKFFSKILNNISLNELSKKINVDIDLLARYSIDYRDDLQEPVFIELEVLLKLLDTYNELEENSNILYELEQNIRGIKGYGRSGILRNPRLPIKEDTPLIRLVVHLIGDGTLTEEYGTSKSPHYTNSSKFLRNQFLQILSSVFGDVSDCSRIYFDQSGKSRSYVAFAKWIGYLIRYLYPDAKFDEKSGSLPSAFFQLPLDLKAEMVRTFGDDDGHVGAHSIRFTSGGATILKQIRKLIVELMEATLPPEELALLMKSVGEVKVFRSWFMLDVFRPVFGWYAEYIGFTHPERVEKLTFQIECDRLWTERGLDGFDLDFLTLIGLRDVGSVGEVARRFMVREDFLFKVFQRVRKLGWIEKVVKRKFTTVYQTTPEGEGFLERVWAREWCIEDRVVMEEGWWGELRENLLKRFGTAAAVARNVGMPETTTRGYLQGRRQWMDARWVVALVEAVGWSVEDMAKGVVVGFGPRLAPRYEQCDFLDKPLGVYQRLSTGEIGFEEWLTHRRQDVVRLEQLLDAGFAKKLQSASAIRSRIIELAESGGGEVTLAELKEDAVLQELVANRYSAYLADRMAKLVKQGVFVRVAKGRYQLVR